MTRRLTRRNLLGTTALAVAGANRARARERTSLNGVERRDLALRIRNDAAAFQYLEPSAPQVANGDEVSLPSWSACFTKGLPTAQNGEVEPGTYETLLRALESRKHADFEAIARGSGRRLVSPQAAYSFCLEGGDPHRFACPPAPSFSSGEMAQEMAEMYWLALARDIPFREYATAPVIQEAARELKTTPRAVFRGPTPGDLDGPYISQFLVGRCRRCPRFSSSDTALRRR